MQDLKTLLVQKFKENLVSTDGEALVKATASLDSIIEGVDYDANHKEAIHKACLTAAESIDLDKCPDKSNIVNEFYRILQTRLTVEFKKLEQNGSPSLRR